MKFAKRIGLTSLALIVIFMVYKAESQSARYFRRCFYTHPQCPNKNVTFHLYTRDHPNRSHQLDLNKPKSILKAKFSHNKPLVVLIHGYTGHKDFSPNTQIRPAYFKKGDFNIISVDYKNLALEPCYFTAVYNLPTVANCTAQLLDHLIDSDIFPLDAIHVIGFSLGAQAAGMVANYLKSGRKLRRITGLDPAKPMFIRAPHKGRLDDSDADFVDVIHTDVFGRGLLLPSGHLDHYANGGFDQPGCYQQTEMSPGSCNHERAPVYYAESVYSDKGFWGFRCTHWYLYALGVCKEEDSESIAEMGYNAKSESRGIYFLTTNRESPYARGKNFTTDTVLPAENLPEDSEDQEVESQMESTKTVFML